ncbi:MAG: aldo/keto reductase [Sedimentisphaerales bacterium]|nr:aldo/keto reductase [Sedimentisphaerales bacterium]
MGRLIDRRQFIKHSAAVAGSIALARLSKAQQAPPRPTATDKVPLGKTGLKISRLGIGTGTNSGRIQVEIGREAFDRLIRYAYDKGITYIDTAQSYRTFEWIGRSIKRLPRERLFILSKIPGMPEDVLSVVDRHRKTFDTDYVDCMLIHCMMEPDWTEKFKAVMEGFDKALEKGWIKAKGVSCHTLGALKAAVESPWPQVHLVRVNPQGYYTDGQWENWARPTKNDISPVMEQIKLMHQKGRGVIGMKLIGNGTFTDPEDRQKAIRFAMACKEINAVVIGFKDEKEIDEAIDRINKALAEV